MPPMDESPIARANMAGIHAHQWILSKSCQAVLQRFEISIRLKFPELMERVYVDAIEVLVRRP